MAKKYSTIHQHEPLRVPSGWEGDKKRLIAQLEETFDDIYRRFGRLDMSDFSAGLRKTLTSQSDDLESLGEHVAEIEVSSERIETELSYIQEAQDATNADVKTLTEKVTTVEQTADGLERTVSEVKSEVNAVDGSVTQLEERVLQVEESTEGLKVEVSEKVTQKEVDESIENIDEFHNTAVDIEANGITMNTTGSIRALVNDIEQLTIDQDGVAAKQVVADEVHAGNIVEMHMSSTAEWKGGIQASLDALPKYLTQETTLTVPAGTYPENVTIKGFVGAALTIQLSPGVNINGKIVILDCGQVLIKASALGDANIYPRSGGSYAVYIDSCQYVLLDKLNISGYRSRQTSGTGGSTYGVQVYDSNVKVRNSCIEYTNNYAYLQELGTFFIQDVIGGSDGDENANLGYSIRAMHGAHGAAYGKIPMSVNGTGNAAATLILSATTPTAGGMEYTEPEYMTETFSISKHCTYLYGVSRTRDDQSNLFSQGRYGTYEVASHTNYWRIGAMWFADAAAKLAGKTIQSATLKIRRGSGGLSNAVGVYLGKVALAESAFASTLTPSFTAAATYPAGSLKRETEGTFDVTALMSAIQAGQALGVFEPRDDYSGSYSPAYTTFYGKGSNYEPTLTVTYK